MVCSHHFAREFGHCGSDGICNFPPISLSSLLTSASNEAVQSHLLLSAAGDKAVQKYYYTTGIDYLFSSIPLSYLVLQVLSIVGQGLKSSVNPEPEAIERAFECGA